MDAFAVHEQLIKDYRSFSEGFVEVRDDADRRQHVEQQAAHGSQWPAPWLALNPSFESGGPVDELVRRSELHSECGRIFRPKKHLDDAGDTSITLHRHQRDAVEVAQTGSSYVLTTGTGSGKSLAYIVPIVDRVLREGSGNGIKAIVVYPMNALANSQREELRKFLAHGYGEGAEPVTFARYTGQEDDEARRAILKNPPDILLTNYVMLELVLTRPDERRSLIRAAEGLRFWFSTSCTPTAGGRARTWLCSSVGFARPAPLGTRCSASGRLRRWRRRKPRLSSVPRSLRWPARSSARSSTLPT